MQNNEFALIKSVLDSSQVIAFPTETVMGLGIVFDDKDAYNLLNQIKRRPEDKPYTLMVSSIADIDRYAYLTFRDRQIINKFMPGPLTVLLNSKKTVPSHVTHGTGVIGIRVPNMKVIRDMISYVGKPLLVPSANRSGEKPCLTYKEVENEFGNELGFIYKENSLMNAPSTILDLTKSGVKIIREGPISLKDIERSLTHMKIAVGSDHGGLDYKEAIKKHLVDLGHEVIDVGTNTHDSCHYPIFGIAVAKKVASGECRFGVVVCTSGEGIAIAANKVRGIRCGIGYNDEVSRLMREHNNANVISFGQKFMQLDDVIRRVDIFLTTEFAGGRHAERVKLICDEEQK